eukprot:UN09105
MTSHAEFRFCQAFSQNLADSLPIFFVYCFFKSCLLFPVLFFIPGDLFVSVLVKTSYRCFGFLR